MIPFTEGFGDLDKREPKRKILNISADSPYSTSRSANGNPRAKNIIHRGNKEGTNAQITNALTSRQWAVTRSTTSSRLEMKKKAVEIERELFISVFLHRSEGFPSSSSSIPFVVACQGFAWDAGRWALFSICSWHAIFWVCEMWFTGRAKPLISVFLFLVPVGMCFLDYKNWFNYRLHIANRCRKMV